MLICYLFPLTIQCFSLGGYTPIKDKIVPKGANCLKCINLVTGKPRRAVRNICMPTAKPEIPNHFCKSSCLKKNRFKALM